MRRRITICILALFAFYLLNATHSYAAGFGANFLNPKRVEADPKKTYSLEMNNGPWMIMVKRFEGENAEQNAKRLVYELRKRYKLNAYVYDRKFEFSVAEGMRSTEKKQHLRNRYAKTETKEYAVLVGDFQSTEDEDFKKALKTVKTSQPTTLKSEIVQAGANKKPPLANAFGTPNPLLPPDFRNRKGVVDAFVERLNSDSKFSLLNCPARYTIRVATFTGNIEIRPNEVDQIIAGKKNMDDRVLEQAGINATMLCQALRKKGYEAYEFHDRYSSIVTVGGFNEITTTDAYGQMMPRPEIVKIIDTFKGEYRGNTSINQASGERMLPYMPKALAGIEFDVQPQVVLAPKRMKDLR